MIRVKTWQITDYHYQQEAPRLSHKKVVLFSFFLFSVYLLPFCIFLVRKTLTKTRQVTDAKTNTQKTTTFRQMCLHQDLLLLLLFFVCFCFVFVFITERLLTQKNDRQKTKQKQKQTRRPTVTENEGDVIFSPQICRKCSVCCCFVYLWPVSFYWAHFPRSLPFVLLTGCHIRFCLSCLFVC